MADTPEKQARRIEALQARMDSLDRRNKELVQRLAEAESRFQNILLSLPHPMLVRRDDRIVLINPSAVETLGGHNAADFLGKPFGAFVAPSTRAKLPPLAERLLNGRHEPQQRLGTLIRLDGASVKVEWIDSVMELDGRPALGLVFRDVTARLEMEEALHASNEALAEKSLRLEEVNRALKLMLDHRQIEKQAVEENLTAGMKKFVLPYLEKLAAEPLNAESRTYLEILRANLNDLLAPLRHRRFARYADLTPTEIQIADLIRQGVSSKSIASQLNVSMSAISFHRHNIRRKFGILNKRQNLRAYLDSLGA